MTRLNHASVCLRRTVRLLAVLLALPVTATAQIAAPDSLDLETAVRWAVERNPELRRAEAEAARMNAGRWESWGQLVPSFDLALGLNESQVLQRTATDPLTGGIIALPDSLIQLRQSFGTSAALSADWTIFDGGRRLLGVRQARATARAADLRLEAARARIATSLTLAYLDALESKQQREVREAELERARTLTEVAETRFEVGEAPEIDLLQARLAESDAEIALLEAEQAYEAARLTLFQYLGIPPDDQVTLVPPDVVQAESLPAEDVLRACVLRSSAELAALESGVRAARQQLAAERWSFLPSVRVGATWVRSEFGQTEEAITFEPRNQQTYYRMQFSWTPLDQPGRWIAERQRARAAVSAAEADLAVRKAAITREAETALGRIRRARTLEERSRLNVDLAERQLMQARERYRLGVGSIVETLQAESLAREAERQRIAARYATLRALAELEQAAGIRLETPSLSCP